MAKRLSVAQLAARSGLSQPYIWQLESGKRKNPGADAVTKLAAGLGVTIGELLGAEEDIADESLADAPQSLRNFVAAKGEELGLRREDIEVLRHIHYRGRRPESVQDWELIHAFLKRILGS